jgi:hypothetical protein
MATMGQAKKESKLIFAKRRIAFRQITVIRRVGPFLTFSKNFRNVEVAGILLSVQKNSNLHCRPFEREINT